MITRDPLRIPCLTDGYWARQKKLEEAVEQARRNLEKIRSGK